MRLLSVVLSLLLNTAALCSWLPVSIQSLRAHLHYQLPVVSPTFSMADKQTVADVLGSERQIGIFASITRDIESVSAMLSGHKNLTVLAPTNGEMSKLPRKPWESPVEYRALGLEAYEGKKGEERAQQNLKKFVEAHVVPQSPWDLGVKATTLGGSVKWLEEEDGKKIIKPDNVEVVDVADVVSNGQLWIIKGVLNYV